MKKKLTLLFSMFACLSGFAYFSLVDAETAPKFQIKMATVAPDGSSWMKVLDEMNGVIKKKSKNEVGFIYYGGGTAGEEPEVIEKMKYNELHAAGFTGHGLGSILPEIRVMEVPQQFKSYEEYDYVLKKLNRRFWKGIYKKGYLLLGWAEGGFVNIFSKQKVMSLEDMKKAKVWLRQGDPMLKSIYQGYEINPIPLSLQDVLPMLQTGKIDTIGVSPLACIALQWQSEVKYRVNSRVYNIMAGLILTKNSWRNLPKKHRRTLYKTVAKYSKILTKISRKDNIEAEEKLKKIGIVTLTPSAEQQKDWEKKGQEIGNKLAGKLFEKKLLVKVRKYLADHRAKQAKKSGK